LGFTEKALDDESLTIRTDAELFFELQKEYSKDEVREQLEVWRLRNM